MHHTPALLRSLDCTCDPERAAADPDCRMSAHRTSLGHVVYYRCYCGFARVKLWRWTHPLSQAS